MKKKSGAKDSKKQKEEDLLAEQKAQQEKINEQKRLMQIKDEQLRMKSSPLVDYGLLSSYQYFMMELAKSGIPQGNVFQFAAQMVLKYEKNTRKNKQELKQIESFNQSIVHNVALKSPRKNNRRRSNPVKNILPFKGALKEEQRKILENL